MTNRSNQHTYWAGAAALVVAATMLLVTPGIAAAASRHTIDVQSQFKDPGELTDMQRVRCGLLEPFVCEVQLGGHSTLSGTMHGYTDYTTWAHANMDGSTSYYTRETFSGTVAGCGRGTFDFMVDDGHVDATPMAGDPLARHLHGTWHLVPGSGTGDLAKVTSADGVEDGKYYPDSSLSGAFTGSVACGN